jgi:D-alanyl-D-alanine carboxypeptidase (penicillin-binding protein 5/6)
MILRRAVIVSALALLIGVPLVVVMHLAGRGRVGPTVSERRPQEVLDVRSDVTLPGEAPVIEWPSSGQSAVGVDGTGSFATSGIQRPAPIASLAKVMTATVILQDHPLPRGASGPNITLDASDVSRYENGPRTRQSNLRVTKGERLTERQALDAILVPSANNIAYALARWDAGSTSGFVDRMNRMAARLGLTDSHYTDPSGYDPSTVSTAADQVNLALTAMNDPTFAEIVRQQSVELPLVGRVRNYNRLLDQEIIGVKTGSTRPAGGCVIFAASRHVGAMDRLVVGAVLGQRGPDLLAAALAASQALERSAISFLLPVRLPAGTRVGVLQRGLVMSDLVTAEDVDFLAWPGVALTVALDGNRSRTRGVGAPLGVVSIRLGNSTTRVGVRGGQPASP